MGPIECNAIRPLQVSEDWLRDSSRAADLFAAAKVPSTEPTG